MENLLGEKVKLILHSNVDWVGYNPDKEAYIVGYDEEDDYFIVSHNPLDNDGWIASTEEVELLNS